MRTPSLVIRAALAMFIAASIGGGCVSNPVRGPSAQGELEAGIALYQQGRYADAASRFKRATELDPALVDAHLYLGRSLLKSGQWSAALPSLRAAYERAPPARRKTLIAELTDSLLQAALGLLRQGEYQDSVAVLREALTLSPESQRARDELGNALVAFGEELFAQGRLAEAIEAFTESIGILPKRLDAYIGLAKAFFEKGALEDALRIIRRALSLAPNSAEVQELLRRLLQGG
jgi:tetratricopeptide (TPR) repeat protein